MADVHVKSKRVARARFFVLSSARKPLFRSLPSSWIFPLLPCPCLGKALKALKAASFSPKRPRFCPASPRTDSPPPPPKAASLSAECPTAGALPSFDGAERDARVDVSMPPLPVCGGGEEYVFHSFLNIRGSV